MAGLFRPFKAYFHDSVPETYHYIFQFYGGQIERNPDCDFSHYFVSDDIEENGLKIVKANRRNNIEKAFKILDYNWITKCLQEKRLVDENLFMY